MSAVEVGDRVYFQWGYDDSYLGEVKCVRERDGIMAVKVLEPSHMGTVWINGDRVIGVASMQVVPPPKFSTWEEVKPKPDRDVLTYLERWDFQIGWILGYVSGCIIMLLHAIWSLTR